MATNASVGMRTDNPAYYDIALRDLGLAMGAFALARLSLEFDDHS